MPHAGPVQIQGAQLAVQLLLMHLGTCMGLIIHVGDPVEVSPPSSDLAQAQPLQPFGEINQWVNDLVLCVSFSLLLRLSNK